MRTGTHWSSSRSITFYQHRLRPLKDLWSRERLIQACTVVVIFVVGLVARIVNLGRLPLTGDEGVTYVVAQAVLERGIPVLDSGLWFHRAMPYSYLVTLSHWLFSDIEFGVRLPSALAGALTGVTIYFLASQLFATKRMEAALVSLVYAIHPWALEIDRFARMYPLFTLLYTAAIPLFYLGFILDKRSYRIWFALTYTLAASIHLPAMTLLALFAFRGLAKGWRSLLERATFRYLLFLVVISVVILLLPSTIFYGNSVERPPDTSLVWGDADIAEKFSSLQLDLLTNLFYALPISSVWLLASAFLFLLSLPFRQHNPTTGAILYLLYGIFISLAALLVWDYKANLRYLAHVLPLILVFCFYTTIDLLQHFVPRLRRHSVTVAAIVCLLLVSSAYPIQSLAIIEREPGDKLYSPRRFGRPLRAAFSYHHFVDYQPDLESAADYVLSHQRPGDGLLVAAIPELFAPYGGLEVDWTIRVPRGAEGALGYHDSQGVARNIYTNTPYISSLQGIRNALAGHERVWIIETYSAHRALEVPPSISHWLESRKDNVVFVTRDGQTRVFLLHGQDPSSLTWTVTDAVGDLQVTTGTKPLQWEPLAEAWVLAPEVELVKRSNEGTNHLLTVHPAGDNIPTVVEVAIPESDFSHLQFNTRLAPKAAGRSNGVRFSIDVLTTGAAPQRLYESVIQSEAWQCVALEASELAGKRLRLTSDAMEDATFDWLTLGLQLYPETSFWSLDDHLCSARVFTDQGPLAWTPDGFQDASGSPLVRQSSLPVEGQAYLGQIHFHPDIKTGTTRLEFDIEDSPYTTLITSFGLADEAGDRSDGVQYRIEISEQGSGAFEVLLLADSMSSTWQHETLDTSAYLGQDILVRLSAVARDETAFDWLQISVRLEETENRP